MDVEIQPGLWILFLYVSVLERFSFVFACARQLLSLFAICTSQGLHRHWPILPFAAAGAGSVCLALRPLGFSSGRGRLPRMWEQSLEQRGGRWKGVD